MSRRDEVFIPATMARYIGDGVFFRPRRSWHSLTYAGEGLQFIPGTRDGSGCVREGKCYPPSTVTHRLYWHEAAPERMVSVFLSYPNGMGACEKYFWEAYPAPDGDIERWTSEEEMERAVKEWLVSGHLNGVNSAHEDER